MSRLFVVIGAIVWLFSSALAGDLVDVTVGTWVNGTGGGVSYIYTKDSPDSPNWTAIAWTEFTGGSQELLMLYHIRIGRLVIKPGLLGGVYLGSENQAVAYGGFELRLQASSKNTSVLARLGQRSSKLQHLNAIGILSITQSIGQLNFGPIYQFLHKKSESSHRLGLTSGWRFSRFSLQNDTRVELGRHHQVLSSFDIVIPL